MIADLLLSRLKKVRQTSPDSWIAACPSHPDKHPSLNIREVDDKLLVHCFSGCAVEDIVAAVGLELSDLFPPRTDYGAPMKRPLRSEDILQALSGDILFLQVCARQMAMNGFILEENRAKLEQAADRFHAALKAGGLV